MYKLVSARSGPDVIAPSVLRLSKDDTFFGDIIVAVTDGIYSYDQVAIGRDEQQQLWISGEASVARLFAALGRFFSGEITQETLRACLQTYLAELQDAKLVSDDCTVAVLVTAKAIAYQLQRRAEESPQGEVA
jgi:hypothetical protein